MGKKNPNLCERPYCREPWSHLISGHDEHFGGRGWVLRVCEEHMETYVKVPGGVYVGAQTTIQKRGGGFTPQEKSPEMLKKDLTS
jgi:hypothetical protein